MVRKKQEWRTISVNENIYNRLEEDRKHFEKTIKGGKWSLNDAMVERQKILDQFKGADNKDYTNLCDYCKESKECEKLADGDYICKDCKNEAESEHSKP